MADETRDEFLKIQLEARIKDYIPITQEKLSALLHFDVEQIIAALTDDQYLFILIDELNEQLKRRQTWTDEQKQARPFWYNPPPVDPSRRKEERDPYDDDDPSVSISLELTRMPTRNAKLAYIGTMLYPKIKASHPHQANKLYSICMNYEFQVLQNAVTNKTALTKLLIEAQLQLENEKRKKDEALIMTVEPAEVNNNENKDEENDGQENGNEAEH